MGTFIVITVWTVLTLYVLNVCFVIWNTYQMGHHVLEEQGIKSPTLLESFVLGVILALGISTAAESAASFVDSNLSLDPKELVLQTDGSYSPSVGDNNTHNAARAQ
jgi:hypothetical protein